MSQVPGELACLEVDRPWTMLWETVDDDGNGQRRAGKLYPGEQALVVAVGLPKLLVLAGGCLGWLSARTVVAVDRADSEAAP